MAIRIRTDGRILCAAKSSAEVGDMYLDDGAHYRIAVELLALRPLPNGEWRFCEQGTRNFDEDPPDH